MPNRLGRKTARTEDTSRASDSWGAALVSRFRISRRAFVISAAAVGGGLAIGFGFRSANFAPVRRAEPGEVYNWITVKPDNTITIRIAQMEMGQGAMTSMTQLLAEELEVDWSNVKAEFISIRTHLSRGKVYGRTLTNKSNAVKGSQLLLRTCGAQIRMMFLRAASERLGVAESELVAKNSIVTHIPTGRTLTYAELASAAAEIAVPESASLKLKEPREWTYIGKSFPRLDIPSKTDGSAIYGIDVTLPGMKHAAIAMSPVFGGTLKFYDGSSVLAQPGVLSVVEIKASGRRGKDAEVIKDRIEGVAVIADQWWRAKNAVEAIPKEWDAGDWGTSDSAAILANMRTGLDASPDKVLLQDGNLEAAISSAERVLEAEYFVPYLEHAAMEPLNCTALVSDEGFEVWAPTQAPEDAIKVAAKVAGLPVNQGNLHITQIGGGFGRRLESDFVAQAVQLAKAMKGTPIKLLWSREETTQHGAYRPANLSHIRGALDKQGNIVGWSHRIVATSDRPGLGYAAAARQIHPIPNRLVDLVIRSCHVPEGQMRGVSNVTHSFVTQCFMDELARAAGKDSYELQSSLLDLGKQSARKENSRSSAARLREALHMAAHKASWGDPLGPQRGRGIAAIVHADSFCSAVVEVTLDGRGWFSVDRVVVAADPSFLVNPDSATAQAEGSVAFALTSAMYGRITINQGRVVESNFHDYPILRIHEMPKVETHWILSRKPTWGGIGELVVPAIAPALVNAIYDAGGPRIRSLPLKNHKIVQRET